MDRKRRLRVVNALTVCDRPAFKGGGGLCFKRTLQRLIIFTSSVLPSLICQTTALEAALERQSRFMGG